MKELKCHLQAIADTLSLLSKQFEMLANKMDSLECSPREHAIPEPLIKPEETSPEIKEIRNSEATAKQNEFIEPEVQEEPGDQDLQEPQVTDNMPVLATVLDIIRKSRKGVNISQIKSETNFSSRQISNALYKLSRIQGKIEAKSRGVYILKKK